MLWLCRCTLRANTSSSSTTIDQIRNAAIQHQGALTIGRVSFMLVPWSRFRRASTSRLLYKARVCLENVPKHAWDVESVKNLFDPASIIDSIDPEVRCEEETGCFRLWVWLADVEKLRTRGILELEEPRELASPDMHFPELGMLEEVPERWGQVPLLGHEVLIHLDRVIDFSSPPDSSPDSNRSSNSVTSGLPSAMDMTADCPAKWGYRWFFGFEDGDFPPPPPRASAHSRLRFPDNGAGRVAAVMGAGVAGGVAPMEATVLVTMASAVMVSAAMGLGVGTVRLPEQATMGPMALGVLTASLRRQGLWRPARLLPSSVP